MAGAQHSQWARQGRDRPRSSPLALGVRLRPGCSSFLESPLHRLREQDSFLRVLLLSLCLEPEAKALPLSVWRNQEPGPRSGDANRAAAPEGGLAVPQVGRQKVTRRPSKPAPRRTPGEGHARPVKPVHASWPRSS